MPYCTQTDLVNAYGEPAITQLTDRINKPPISIDTTVLDAAIASAEGEIDMYLAARYKLPITDVPGTLVEIAIKLAYRKLFTNIKDDHPAELEAARAIKKLEGLANGRLSLGLDQGGAPAPVNNTVQITEGRNDWARGTY